MWVVLSKVQRCVMMLIRVPGNTSKRNSWFAVTWMALLLWPQSSHLYQIWIPHPGFLCFLLSLIRQNLMMRLCQMTLGKITWASISFFHFIRSIPPYHCCFFLSLSNEGSFCCQVCLALDNCIQMLEFLAVWSCRGQNRLCCLIKNISTGRSKRDTRSVLSLYK